MAWKLVSHQDDELQIFFRDCKRVQHYLVCRCWRWYFFKHQQVEPIVRLGHTLQFTVVTLLFHSQLIELSKPACCIKNHYLDTSYASTIKLRHSKFNGWRMANMRPGSVFAASYYYACLQEERCFLHEEHSCFWTTPSTFLSSFSNPITSARKIRRQGKTT